MSAQAADAEGSNDRDTGVQKTKAPPMSPREVRQAQLMADTKRLYALAEELRAEVAKTNKDTLSLTVVKKAEEVEKLAKSIKERMRIEAGSTQP